MYLYMSDVRILCKVVQTSSTNLDPNITYLNKFEAIKREAGPWS